MIIRLNDNEILLDIMSRGLNSYIHGKLEVK
jgi:hypothetical protein